MNKFNDIFKNPFENSDGFFVCKAKDNNDDLFLEESADLLFHYLMLLQAKGYKLNSVVDVLKGREK